MEVSGPSVGLFKDLRYETCLLSTCTCTETMCIQIIALSISCKCKSKCSSQFVSDSHTLSWMHTLAHLHYCTFALKTSAGRQTTVSKAAITSRSNTAVTLGQLYAYMDVKLHYIHHSGNTVQLLLRMPFRAHIEGYGLRHVMIVIGSLWTVPGQSSSAIPLLLTVSSMSENWSDTRWCRFDTGVMFMSHGQTIQTKKSWFHLYLATGTFFMKSPLTLISAVF